MEKVYITTPRWGNHYKTNPVYKEMIHWIKCNIGPSHWRGRGSRQTVWMNRYLHNNTWVFSFADPREATAFALKWT